MPAQVIRRRQTPADVRSALQRACDEAGYDPFKELIRLATETFDTVVDGKTVTLPLCDTDQKISIAKELAQYLAPKLKGIEVEGQVDHEFTLKILHFNGETKEKIVDVPSSVATGDVVEDQRAIAKMLPEPQPPTQEERARADYTV